MKRPGFAIVLAAACGIVSALAQDGPSKDAPWFNPDLPMTQRVDALVAQMTIEEKASQLVNQARAIPRLGIPAYNWWNEALHGVARNGIATNFPQSIGLAATFDTPLMHRIATVIAVEGRAKYNEALRHDDHSRFAGLTFWSPR